MDNDTDSLTGSTISMTDVEAHPSHTGRVLARKMRQPQSRVMRVQVLASLNKYVGKQVDALGYLAINA